MAFLPGFDDRWQDVPDYIFGITKDIWEDRRIDSLTEYYGRHLIVRSPASVVRGNTGIIAATQSTLAEFPDRELLGEDVIWCATGKDSFLSSHRLLCTATHTGNGMYGTPTGKQLTYRILADCWCQNNGVHDEWLVRDQGAIVLQMGHNIPDWTRALIHREGGPDTCVRPLTTANDVAGPYAGAGNETNVGSDLAGLLGRIMQGELSVVPAHWDRAAELAYPCHVQGHGHGAADAFWLGLRSALPDATFEIEHIVGMTDPLMPPRAAVRWRLDGRHSGWGRFGAPTSAPLHIMGITHAEFGPHGLRREWTLIDDTAIWKQILLHTGQV